MAAIDQASSPTETKSVKTFASADSNTEKKSKYSIKALSSSSTFNSANEFVHNSPTARRISKPLDRYIFPWWWEVFSGICSLALLAGIVSILLVVENKSISSWHFPIQPNAVISVLTTLGKAGLIVAITGCIGQLKWVHLKESRQLINVESFDEATRGPIGSFFFLFNLKGRPVLASTGAILTILAILIEPFSQQVISFQSRLAISHSNGTSGLSVTQVYDTGLRQDDDSPMTNQLDRDVLGSSVGSLYGIDVQPPYTCDAVQCIWRDVTTLNICESCQNSVPGTKRSCEDLAPLSPPPEEGLHQIAGQMCNFTPPNFPDNIMSLTFRGYNGGGMSRQMTNYTFIYEVNEESGEVPPHPDSWLGDFSRISVPVYNTTPIPDPETAECTLSWCARHYDTITIINGTYAASPPTTLTFSNRSTFWNASDNELAYVTLEVDPDLHPDFAGNRSFTLNTESKWYVGYAYRDLLDAILDNGGGWVIGNSLNVSNDVRIMNEGVSNALRKTRNNTVLPGEIWNYETYMRVRWPWMILPAILVVGGNVLLVIAIVISERSDAPLWKNSTLALLLPVLVGRDVETEADVRKSERKGAMKKRAKEMKVALIAGHDGHRKLSVAPS